MSKKQTEVSSIKRLLLFFLIIFLTGMIFFLTLQIYLEKKDRGPLAGITVILAGDSRSSTDYAFYQDLLMEKGDCEVWAAGASGRNAAYNASSEYFDALSQKPHDFSLWLVGGNDTGESGTVGTFFADSKLARMGEPVVYETDLRQDYEGNTFIQAIDHMMRKYKELYYDFRKLKDGHKPVMIFCTDLPQQRQNAESEWSKKENWERKCAAIVECGEKNQIPILDLYTMCGFDMSYEPIYSEPTDKIHNSGVYFMDGLHPNADGYDRITSLEIAEMIRYLPCGNSFSLNSPIGGRQEEE